MNISEILIHDINDETVRLEFSLTVMLSALCVTCSAIGCVPDNAVRVCIIASSTTTLKLAELQLSTLVVR